MKHTRCLRLCCAALSLALLLTLCPAAQAQNVSPAQYEAFRRKMRSSYEAPDRSFRVKVPNGWVPLKEGDLKNVISDYKPDASLEKFLRKEARQLDDEYCLFLVEQGVKRNYYSVIRIYANDSRGIEETAGLMKAKKNTERAIAKTHKGWKRDAPPTLFCYNGLDMMEIQGTFLASEGERIGMRYVYVVNCGITYTVQLMCDVDALDELASVQNDAMPYFDWE